MPNTPDLDALERLAAEARKYLAPGDWTPSTPNNPTWINAPSKLGDGDLAHVLDVRGWGYLTGGGHALALDHDEAFKAQKAWAAFVLAAVNSFDDLLRTIRAYERREAEMVEALHDANKMLCRAHARIHGLPRTTDTLLAREIENHRAKFKDEYARAALAARKEG